MSATSQRSEQNLGEAVELLSKTLVVIPTLNEEKHIETCIRSLMTERLVSSNTKVIVADGGSSDSTLEIVEALSKEFSSVQIVDNPEKLQSAGINRAVQIADQSQNLFLVRCDAHSIYPEDFVERVVVKLDEVDAASLVVPMDAVGQGCFGKANAWIVDTPLGSGGSAHRAGTTSGYIDHGHHAGFKLDTFLALGGYDPTFSHNEDAEYDHRVAARGDRIFLDADIRIQYVPRSTAYSLAKQYFNYGKGRAKNALKHGKPLRIRQAVPILAFLSCIASIALAFWNPLALAVPALYLSVLASASLFISVKHKSVCGLFAGPASGIMHMAWASGFLKQLIFGAGDRRRDLADLSSEDSTGMSVDNLSSVGTNVKQKSGSVLLLPWRGLNRVVYMVHRDLSRFTHSLSPRPVSRQRENHAAPKASNRGVQGLKKLLAPSTRRASQLDAQEQSLDGVILNNVRGVSAPAGEAIYAIGDVHGQLSLLEKLLDKIDVDAKSLPEGTKPVIVFLGDYIDRGLQSKQVIDLLTGDRLAEYETVFIAGNHEEALLNFVSEPSFGARWSSYGGAETLFSYGVTPPLRIKEGEAEWVSAWKDFRAAIPDSHMHFFSSLQHYHIRGDFIFVHAGLRPGVAFSDQKPKDMMWIRDRFLKDKSTFSKLVVHGHTPSQHPELDHRRLGLDTGAYSTGILTAARLNGLEIKIVST